MKICILSDSHDRSDPLVAAIVEARAAGAQAVIHCGDLIGANTLRASLKLNIPIHAVHGNNIGDVAALYRMMDKSNGLFVYHGQEAVLELGGRRIFVTHMPNHGNAFACTGDYDLVCHGHSHTAYVGKQSDVKGGHCWLVNPGSVAGIDAPGVNAVPTWRPGRDEFRNTHFAVFTTGIKMIFLMMSRHTRFFTPTLSHRAMGQTTRRVSILDRPKA